MASYAVVNLKEIEDQAPKFGLSPNLEARFARSSLGLEKSGLSYQRLAPGFRIPWGHKHKQQEEIYILLSGSVHARLGDESVELREWDVLRVPPETMRGFEAGPEGAEFLAFGAPSTESPTDDIEMEQNWWTD